MLPKNQKGLSRLSLFYSKSRIKNIRNKFYSKAQCFRANFSNASFINVNFKGAILTNCSFKHAEFSQVEFLGSNLKKSNFTNATFRYCVFSATLLKKSNFKGCTFENCIFVNTNVNVAKNMIIGDSNRFFSQHPSPVVSASTMHLLDELRFHPKIQNSRVLHLKGGKLNSLTVFSLLERLGEEKLVVGLKNLNGTLPYRIVTANGLCNAIDKASRES
ncbi:pentapeptide repeat-containing protein [Vibrio alginolyticus]|uniref:pentapeptide repeat-containing protein n=2 Tax=Vibrio harveyi group TaxID=717610 RepID=UPI001BD6452E|nr:pentapeptide repeat-containing protein [Vibrio vulnificus]MBT0014470.1 pentapeptide repeat-containing protein [Vibrio alginolyticus]MDF4654246.1 pentapeptide repeat-containing protein [Vibrio parahaemolyticus]ELV8746744.1 pentapeptide repeat-containing protein [Vibrio vulnificus]ELV8755410.1 pentapeptide repeat-containing protein [Vibrio vulnificus]